MRRPDVSVSILLVAIDETIATVFQATDDLSVRTAARTGMLARGLMAA
jgi:hypothetical protein